MADSYKTPDEIEASIAGEFARELAVCDELTEAYLSRCERPHWIATS